MGLQQAPAPEHGRDSPTVVETDALVIGAGPVGLYLVFQLGLLEIAAHVIDSLPYPGGQPVELYPDKPIYDLPAIPVCTGKELTEALLLQIRPFAPVFHLGQTVAELVRLPDRRFLATTSGHQRFLTRAVFVAAGIGAFEPKRLPIQSLKAHEQDQVFFHPEPLACLRDPARILVAGGGSEAVSAALRLIDAGHEVSVVHRRDALEGTENELSRLKSLRAQGRLAFHVGQPTDAVVDGDRLQGIEISASDNSVTQVPLDFLLVRQGISPRLGPLATWGLPLERKQVPVDPQQCATSEPGVFAVGDINTYPGKRKFILCGFHEALMAAYGAAAYLRPGHKTPIQYTTTSPRLHELLGVKSDV